MLCIPLTDCKHGGLYRLSSRNLLLGVFNKNTSGFVGIREKFGDHYLFTEFHWDTSAPFGTVRPIELLEMYPDEPNESIYDKVTEEYLREHLTLDKKLGDLVLVDNKILYTWLEQKEKDYLV